jgi:methionine sulfoxide reductase heme-binding subunit
MDQSNSTRNTDLLVLVASLIVIGLSASWMIGSGMFNFTLLGDEKLSWHLVRSSGMVAYVLLLASTVWGLLLSSQSVKDWSPGPVSLTLHSTISWLALLLGLGHGLLLLFDKYFTYTLGDILVPFTGPYRPEAVGLGTLAFWLLVAISLSFPLKKRIGQTNWKRLHYTSYGAFGLVSLHGLFAGTDGTHLGFRLLVGGGMLLVFLLLGIRVGKDQTKLSPSIRNKSQAQ